ncbi:DUF7716 domain-containing protein [Anaerocolumna jejuensis]
MKSESSECCTEVELLEAFLYYYDQDAFIIFDAT